MAHLLGNLAASAASHWKRSLAIVLAVLVTLGVLASVAGGSFTDDFSSPGTESQKAMDLLEQRFPAQSGDTATVVFSVESGTLRDGARPQAIAAALDEIRDQPHVTAAADPLEAKGQVSRDGRIAFATVQYDEPAMDLGKQPGERLEVAAAKAERDGIEVSRRGQVVDQSEQQTAPVGELIGIAVAVIVLTLVFHSAAAMMLTLFASLLSLAGGMMLLTIGSAFTDFPSFAPTLGVMLGLGAGIDYALLIVGRYREQLATGDSVDHAARVANQTAGTSIVAAGTIVVVAITGLLATGLPFVGRMGLGSAIMVATVAVGAVTILPVLMGAFARQPAAAEAGARRALARVRALGQDAHAPPLGRGRRGRADPGRARVPVRVAAARSARRRQRRGGLDHPRGLRPPGGGLRPRLQRPARAGRLAARRRRTTPPRSEARRGAPWRARRTWRRSRRRSSTSGGDAATITVIPKSSPQDERTSQLVERLRDDVLPAATAGTGAAVYVGGATAIFEDLADKIASRLPDLHRAGGRAVGDPADGGVPLRLGAAGVGGASTCSRSSPPTAWSSRSSRTAGARRCSASTARCRSCPSCRCSCSRSCSG